MIDSNVTSELSSLVLLPDDGENAEPKHMFSSDIAEPSGVVFTDPRIEKTASSGEISKSRLKHTNMQSERPGTGLVDLLPLLRRKKDGHHETESKTLPLSAFEAASASQPHTYGSGKRGTTFYRPRSKAVGTATVNTYIMIT